MKRFEELAKATNEYRNYLISVNEKAGERIIPSVDVTTYPLDVCKPSIFVDGAFKEIIKNSDQVEKEDLDTGNIMYWVTVEGIKFWFIEGGKIMSWEEMLDHLIEEVGAEAVLDEIVLGISWREHYELWNKMAEEIDLQFHYEDGERDRFNILLAEVGARDLLDHVLYYGIYSGVYHNGDEAVESTLRDVGEAFDIYFPMDGD